MTGHGQKHTCLTDKERLYEWACLKTEQDEKAYPFPETDHGCESYFESVDLQPVLEEYDIRGRDDLERYLERYFDESLSDVKIECVRAFLKSYANLEKEKPEQEHAQRRSKIPEFIYNF